MSWFVQFKRTAAVHLSPNYSSLLEQMSPKLSWGHQIIADEDNRTLKLATSSLISKPNCFQDEWLTKNIL